MREAHVSRASSNSVTIPVFFWHHRGVIECRVLPWHASVATNPGPSSDQWHFPVSVVQTSVKSGQAWHDWLSLLEHVYAPEDQACQLKWFSVAEVVERQKLEIGSLDSNTTLMSSFCWRLSDTVWWPRKHSWNDRQHKAPNNNVPVGQSKYKSSYSHAFPIQSLPSSMNHW